MKIKMKLVFTVLMLFCLSIIPIILVEEVSAAEKSYEFQVLDLVNKERMKADLAPVAMDKELYNVAKIRAKELNKKYSHTRPDGTSWETIHNKEYMERKLETESISKGPKSPKQVMYGSPIMGGWMKEKSNKEAILNPYYKSIGIGYFKSSNSYWVIVYGYAKADKIFKSPSTKIKKITNSKTFFKIGTKKITLKVYTDNSIKSVSGSILGKSTYKFAKSKSGSWGYELNTENFEIGYYKVNIKAIDKKNKIYKSSTYLTLHNITNPIHVYDDDPLILKNKKQKVYYLNNTTDPYEKSINILNKYATVYEGDAEGNLGITYRNENSKKITYSVTIAYKDQFVVYHELAHVLHYTWSEYNCDWYAYNKTGYWIHE